MILGTAEKQPADKLDYDIDYSRWLSPGDALASVAVVVPAGLTLLASMIVGQTVKVWLKGGEHGKTYKVEVTVTTSGERIKQDEFKLKVR